MMYPLIFRRRQLLPVWIKVFVWIFLLLGLSGIVTRCLEVAGISFGFGSEKTIYGLTTYEQFSLLSLFISSLIIFKGVVAFGMWTEKDWAIKFGIIDAVIGILITITMMFIEPLLTMDRVGTYDLHFQFEILLLIPYLIFCVKVKFKWENFNNVQPVDLTEMLNSDIASPAIEKKSETKNTDIKIEIEKEEIIDKEDPRRFMPK